MRFVRADGVERREPVAPRPERPRVGPALTSETVLSLQRCAGNRSVTRLLSRTLTIDGNVHDNPFIDLSGGANDRFNLDRPLQTAFLNAFSAANIKLGLPVMRQVAAQLNEWAADGVKREPMTAEQAVASAVRAVTAEKNRSPIDAKQEYDKRETSATPRYRTTKQAPAQTPASSPPPPLTHDLWGRIAHLALGPLAVVDAQPFITNPADYAQLELVIAYFRDLVHEIALQHGIDLRSPEFNKPHTELTAEEFGWFKALGDHILRTRPPDKYVYLVPGGSLLGVGVYMQQASPDARVVNMPISGLTFDAMFENPRTFDDTQLGTYYHSYLRPHLAAVESGAKLLLMDYASGGDTLKTLELQIGAYLKSVGISPSQLERFAFGDATGYSLGPPEHVKEMRSFVMALKNQRFKKEHLHVLYHKPPDKEGDFTGRVEDKHMVFVERYMVLWDEIAAHLAAEH